jgi:hypothetical protein
VREEGEIEQPTRSLDEHRGMCNGRRVPRASTGVMVMACAQDDMPLVFSLAAGIQAMALA